MPTAVDEFERALEENEHDYGVQLSRPARKQLGKYYELLLKWTPEEASADATSGPSIFTAIQDTLGLRLVAGKELVDVLVVDHVERPTAN